MSFTPNMEKWAKLAAPLHAVYFSLSGNKLIASSGPSILPCRAEIVILNVQRDDSMTAVPRMSKCSIVAGKKSQVHFPSSEEEFSGKETALHFLCKV